MTVNSKPAIIMNQTQLKIRIHLDQSADHPKIEQNLPELPEESVFPPLPPVYEYNWPRIIIAGLVLLFVLITSIWIAADWLSDDEELETSSTEISLSTVSPASSETPSTEPVPSLPSVGFSSDQPSENNLAIGNVPDGDIGSDQAVQVSDPQPQRAAPSASAPPVKPGIKPDITIPQAKTKNVSQGSNHSSGLIKAQLTSNIRQRQPVDNIDQISLGGKSSRPIFLFLHLNKFRGEKILINWYYRDQSIARIVLPVGNNDWRTYSSKVLNRNRLGPWHVTASDQAGNLLAEFKFRVTR